MNTNIKGKLFSITIIVLLLVNTAAIALVLLHNGKQKKVLPQQREKGGTFVFLVKELKLDSNQESQYSTLRNAHKASTDSIGKLRRVVKDSLFQLLKTNISTDAIVQKQLNEVAYLEKAYDEITFNHFKQVRALCNIQQQKRFDEIIGEAIKISPAQKHPPHDRRPPEDREPNGRPEDDNRPPPQEK